MEARPGEPHLVVRLPGGGGQETLRGRASGAVLLWHREGVTYRLESALPRDAAIGLAETVR